jgi:hypothetical protein
MQTDKSNV